MILCPLCPLWGGAYVHVVEGIDSVPTPSFLCPYVPSTLFSRDSVIVLNFNFRPSECAGEEDFLSEPLCEVGHLGYV